VISGDTATIPLVTVVGVTGVTFAREYFGGALLVGTIISIGVLASSLALTVGIPRGPFVVSIGVPGGPLVVTVGIPGGPLVFDDGGREYLKGGGGKVDWGIELFDNEDGNGLGFEELVFVVGLVSRFESGDRVLWGAGAHTLGSTVLAGSNCIFPGASTHSEGRNDMVVVTFSTLGRRSDACEEVVAASLSLL